MNEETVWAIYFAGIASLKFHPRNQENIVKTGFPAQLIEAALIADRMLDLHKERFPCRG